jgi:hypothetical protein
MNPDSFSLPDHDIFEAVISVIAPELAGGDAVKSVDVLRVQLVMSISVDMIIMYFIKKL